MKKKLLLCICMLTLCVCLPFSAAAQTAPTAEVGVTEESVADADLPTDTTHPENAPEDITAEFPDGVPEDMPEDMPENVDEQTPFSDAFATFFDTYLGEIFCVLTFIGSMVCAFLYKTGLMPLVRSGISALGDRVKKNGEDTTAFIEGAGKTLTVIEQSLAPAVATAEAARALTEETAARYEALCDILSREAEDHRRMREILLTETELFYQMLQSVSLPQAQKESMTESYYALKRRLEEEK